MAFLVCPFNYGHVHEKDRSHQDGDTTYTVISKPKVDIVQGQCDCNDLCNIKHCPFYDDSHEASRAFFEAKKNRYGLMPDEREFLEKQDEDVYLQLLQMNGIVVPSDKYEV